ncbi:MAG: hypothetical protein ACOYNG_01275 [Terrimicrobiaceae bacterium]
MRISLLDLGWRGRDPAFVHAYATCAGGEVFTSTKNLPGDPVLLVLRKNNLRRTLAAIEFLRRRCSKILVTIGRSSSHDLAAMLGDTTRWELFRTICSTCDGVISPVPELVPLLLATGAPQVEFLPVPIQVPDAVRQVEGLRGIFVGTREFCTPARHHLAAVALADTLSRRLAIPLAVLNSEGRDGGMLLKDFQRRNPLFYIIEAPVTRADFLDVMRLHRIVWQLDATSGPGRIAADSIFCGIPCVGGNGAIESLAFPGLCGPRAHAELLQSAERLLTDDSFWMETMHSALEKSRSSLSFASISERLAAFCA